MPATRKRRVNNGPPGPRCRPSKRQSNNNPIQNHSNQETVVDNTNQTGDNNNQQFTEDQLQQLRSMIKDTVAVSCRDIATEAAQAAVNAYSTAHSRSTTIDTNTVQASEPNNPTSNTDSTEIQCLSPQLPPSSVPNQNIPASYVKEIQTGEFFDLSKLLPRNLSLYDEEDNLTLTLENSIIKVSKKKKSGRSQITDIEQWITAFTSYMGVFTHKYC